MRSRVRALWYRAGGPGGAAAPRFAPGERTAADLVAPSAVEERRDQVHIDGELSRVLALHDYPRHVSPDWLGRVIDSGEPLDLSLHLEPLDSGEAISALTQRLVALQSSRLWDARGGRIAPAGREVAYEDAERLRDALERGDERVFSGGLYLRLRARSPEELDRATERVRGTFSGMMAGARAALYEMWPALLSCLPAGQDHLGRRRNLDTSSAATMIPFSSSQLAVERGLLYGENVHNSSLVILDPFSAEHENANKVVFAKSGAGKSFACKVEALRALLLGIEYVVIDPEGEYGRLAEAAGGRVVRLTGSEPCPINPFELPRAGVGGDVLASRVLALHGLLGLMLAEPGQSLGRAERGVLDEALYECYRRCGITTDPATHGRPAPLMRDLLRVLREREEPHGLASRLSRYVEGSLGRLFSEGGGGGPGGPGGPFVVFDSSGLEEELRPLATYLVADHVWERSGHDPRPRMLLVDEAWSLMRRPEGARFLSELARRARKRWLGLTTVTQDVGDFLHSPEGRTVLGQSSLQLLMRQDASAVAAVEETFGLSSAERAFLLAARRGEGLLLARGNRVALRIEASPYEYELCTTDPADLARGAGAPGEEGNR
ncbi:MAG: DUF87 domain-containing protein [Chloroflexi bacterium]|nr:DUF87 domain-containing protein [Chloroflexota bacterium]